MPFSVVSTTKLGGPNTQRRDSRNSTQAGEALLEGARGHFLITVCRCAVMNVPPKNTVVRSHYLPDARDGAAPGHREGSVSATGWACGRVAVCPYPCDQPPPTHSLVGKMWTQNRFLKI